ncbi:TNFAIP3-interacting protein 1 [Syngnathus scovelli]|uniref:TNFAIP3-interacting protein 1 n=1 Tax=Syngnathus scovelli TaxID=161590 RepID=UPI0021102799|nr:TNFAIP3-interacting protein 3 [Syngnathus scovelli]XP_049598361.1 TNFAIP3-interacting protein 3 [Syngnathus scovelli]XP_049598365.1 TNFAIP3-interacting protein 3 [Syngnathus scovelli]
MDQEKLALTSSSSSAAHKDSSVTSELAPRRSSETSWSPSVEQHVADSMSITSADQEKLLLLNKNTELRRVNKELMKMNEEWDQMYRNTTLGLQHRLEGLEMENASLKELNGKLLLKVDNQQSAKDYYEQTLMLELKKNQELQEYVRLLEQQRQQPPIQKDRVRVTAPNFSSSSFPVSSPSLDVKQKANHRNCDSHQEVLDLKEQLEALRCQTKIYEAEYQTEHSNHKHTLQDNQRLRRKGKEMHQQLDLLQEQLKVYEDDFRRERSDKQMLQRLLLKKTAPNKDPVLVHRCNNELQPEGSDKRTQTAARKQHHPLCPKHMNRS